MELGFKVFDPVITTAVAGRGDVASGTPTLTSFETTPGQFVSGVSFQVNKTGTLAGTLTAECSNASDNDNDAGAPWDTYSITIPAVVTGTQTFGFELPGFSFGRVRLKFVATSGTGTITARINITRYK